MSARVQKWASKVIAVNDNSVLKTVIVDIKDQNGNSQSQDSKIVDKVILL